MIETKNRQGLVLTGVAGILAAAPDAFADSLLTFNQQQRLTQNSRKAILGVSKIIIIY